MPGSGRVSSREMGGTVLTAVEGVTSRGSATTATMTLVRCSRVSTVPSSGLLMMMSAI